jgi:hypothetical protein
MMTIEETDGAWHVMDGSTRVAGPFGSNAAAWKWIDDNSDSGRDDSDRYNRIRVAFGGGDPSF